MKIFISWSGELSRAVANLLREWLPNVIQTVEPYVSAKDIEKGAAWFTDISRSLRESEFGLICLTKDNLESTWIHFEAGAIANRFEMNRISSLLIELSPTDVKPALGQFQHTLPTNEDMFSLMQTLNNYAGGASLKDEQLLKAFNKWWPDFERQLQSILKDTNLGAPQPHRTQTELLGEILELTRKTARVIDTSQPEQEYRRFPVGKWSQIKHQALTLLILHLNHMLDTGKYDDITIEEVHEQIDKGTILQFLREKGGNDIDLSVHMDSGAYGNFEEFYVKNLQSLYDAYAGDENRRWGVRNKGLCLLLAWTNEIIQLGRGWRAFDNFSER